MLLREMAYVPVTLLRQYGGRAALRRFQLRRLNRFLAHANAHVPYYRGTLPRLESLADLARLPLVTKAVMRATPNRRFVADGVDTGACLEWSSSGTTGHRVTGWHDMNAHDYHMAACVRRFFATRRYLPWDRLAHLKPFPMPGRLVEKVGLFRRHVILTTAPPAEWIADLLAYRPKVLIGYPVHLRELVRTMTPAQRAALRKDLRLVLTESELLVPACRALLEEGFGVPVRDEYSAYETLNIYFECHLGGRHIAEDRVWVEVLDEHGDVVPDGTEGQIVVTAFWERAMPLVRYALGDIGTISPEPCRCGRRFRTMTLTSGRMNDAVVLPDGRKLFGDVFLGVAMYEPGVAEMYVRQDAAGTISVYVVPDGSLPAERVLAGTERTLQERAGAPVPLRMHLSDRIPLTPGGKGQLVRSEYAPALAVNRAD
ncbi:phenylacetate--CoA ligase family protein [Dactylosporangium aurantiacum]|uniref:Phenylacetate--CoA ligase family protein n=1 Tax=Dactylosporangium aurantiacum TaxID=35754 RepID=A0A9Q9IA70_9ACTN|nr:phenylacetate--CoA ligase family protein [Dactylosporangium aurantiacum]MDG6106422.1 phenylacetate--CoA ligase family protein [Dactylosporangium aurantiacum]UWZ50538.1 phenylacetate--CoA ligase family protein [Dactylosporangium aurantiacum]